MSFPPTGQIKEAKTVNTVTNITKGTPEEELRQQIEAVAARATTGERQSVADIITRAKNGKRGAELFTLTPPMCALIFLHHNQHNRDWCPEGPKSTREYARRFSVGEWKWNNATLGFYVDGLLADGQHRLSGAALAGCTYDVVIVFGMESESIVTVDDGKGRHAADAAKLDGIRDAKTKQQVIKYVASYHVRLGDKSAGLKSEAQIKAAIKTNDALLDQCIEVAALSREGIADPLLMVPQAAALCYLLVNHGWSLQAVRHKIAAFQTGVSSEGEKAPSFIAAEAIKAARKRADTRDRLNRVKEIGAAIFALVSTERGIKAISKGNLLSALKKGPLPDPTFPVAEQQNVA